MSQKAYNKDPRRGDDRNLVLVDQDFGQPDLEDRMWLFWIRNKTAIVGVGVLIILGILGYIGWHAAGDFKLSAMQAEYQGVADTPEARLAFARDHEGHPLAGAAALAAADSLFKEKKYGEATSAYVLARKNFAANDNFQAAFAGRALLGEAFSKLKAADREGAVAALTELAKASAATVYPNAERAQAMYNLALLALEKKNYTEAREWLDSMDRDVDPMNPWQEQKQELIAFVPELAKAPAMGIIPAAQPAAPSPAATPASTPAP